MFKRYKKNGKCARSLLKLTQTVQKAADLVIFDVLKTKENLTNSEKQLADYILSHPEEASHMSASELAQACYISKPTVIRFYRKIGFDSFDAFRTQLVREAEPEQRKSSSLESGYLLQQSVTLQDAVENISADAVAQITNLRRSIQPERLQAVCHLVSRYRKIDVYGRGFQNACCQEFCLKMHRIGYDTNPVVGHPQEFAQSYIPDSNRLAMILSQSGPSAGLLEVARELHDNGIPIVLITANRLSALTRYAAEALIIRSPEEPDFGVKMDTFGYLYGVHFVLDCIYAGVFFENREQNTTLLQKLRASQK